MKTTHRLLITTLLAGLSIAPAIAAGTHAGSHGESAIGQPGKTANVTRTIQVDMSDSMRFSAPLITVKQGETIRFVVKNLGKVKHEFSLGTEQELLEHYEVMKKFPDMEHDEPSKISLAPGGKGEVIWHFSKAGTVNFACLHPGHYDAGMKGRIKVAKQ
ncbi:putative cupredoxin-like copper-binding protein [Vogesella indigofera]|uniref:Putative cupredoxin-like copper-binding protein n=1 Tax=Vogesella indigofera TaxID=45465 RepID=A0A495BJG3_VOGIN|nr:cupredoxin family protein [Vogesella indigofera]RKQ61479.1 putative cupredoxin-like copper-binding protein [Vogesella indigofera]